MVRSSRSLLLLAALGGPALAPLPARAEAPASPLVSAPAPARPWLLETALEAGLAGGSAGLVWGLAGTEPAHSALAGAGSLGAYGVLGLAAVVPPLAPAAVSPWEPGALAAGLAGNLLGVALGSALTAAWRDPASPAASPLAAAGVFALTQGLGTALAREAYRRYGRQAPNQGVLDPRRRDDPVLDWNLQRERRNP